MVRKMQGKESKLEEYLTPPPIIRSPGESITMDFPEAMREIMNGKSIRRMSWLTASDYCLLKDGWLTIHTKGAFHNWSVNDGDMEGQDWIVVKELN